MLQLEMSHTVPENVANSYDFTFKWMPCSSELTTRELHTKSFKGAYMILYHSVICLSLTEIFTETYHFRTCVI